MTGSTEISLIAAANEGGGAAIGQVIGMTAVAVVIGVLLCWLGYLHRARKITWVNSVAEYAGRKFKRPPWVAVPIALFIATLICALFGFIWDVSLHIGKGRDPGPLANPAHYFILIGLFLLFVAGCAAIVLPYDKPGPFAIRITRNWYAPVGGVLMAGCGLYALTGFPLDDIWHRIFGQDVTLWGPTHLMMIGGAGFSTITALLLEYEGQRAMGDDAPKEGIGLKFIKYLGFAGIIIGLSVFQIEFDFGVPQFRQVFEPMLIAAAGAFGLVAARMMLGRGAAILAALIAIALRGVVALDGRPGARCADQLVRAVPRRGRSSSNCSRSPRCSNAPSSSVWSAVWPVSTVGLWLESLWIDAVYHYPWPSSIWPEALMMAVPVTVSDRRLRSDARHGAHRSAATEPRDRHRTGRADGGGHRRGDRQRTALPGTAEHHRHDHADRGARLRRQAHGDGRRADQSARSDQRGPELGVGPRLAGRSGQRPGHLHRPPREARTRPLPVHPTDAGVGLVEDAAAGAGRQDSDCRANLPGRATRVSVRLRCPPSRR